MRQRGARNEGFFKNQQAGAGAGAGAAALEALYRGARQSGALNLSQKSLDAAPAEVFALDAHAGEGEKFWEFCSLTKLDLSHNTIVTLPPEVGNLVDLTSLKMRHNRLSLLPPELLGCPRLRHLDLADNCLSDPLFCAPSSRDCPTAPLLELAECFLTSNKLQNLPRILCYCSSLRVLNVGENQLTTLPPEISLLHGLTHLSINQNQLGTLPPSLAELTSLVELNIRKNQLCSLPDFSGMVTLQVLDVGENKLTEVPRFSGRAGLQRLHLEFNQLTSVPESLYHSCQHCLFELHLHDNKIQELSPSVALLTELKVLDVSNNDLNDLPPTLGYIATLQRLLVEGNPIRAIRRTLLCQSTLDLKKYLCTRGPPLQASTMSGREGKAVRRNVDEYNEFGWKNEDCFEGGDIPLNLLQRLRDMDGSGLNLSGLNLTTMPHNWTRELQRSHCFDSMDTSISVTSINFSNNCLDGVPKELFTSQFASALKELILTSNELGGRIHRNPCDVNPLIPPCIKLLNLSKNGLSSQEVSDLLTGVEGSRPVYSLTNLLLPYNRISSMPRSLSLHTSLRELQLASNRLTTMLSVDFSAFPHLTILDVSNNQIAELGNVHEAHALQTLLLENNNLHHVPAELALLEQLQTLTLFGNPQKTIRQALIHKGAEAILLFLRGKLQCDKSAIGKEVSTSLRTGAQTNLHQQQMSQNSSEFNQQGLLPSTSNHYQSQQHHHEQPMKDRSEGYLENNDAGRHVHSGFRNDYTNVPSLPQREGHSSTPCQTGPLDDSALKRFEAQIEAISLQLEHPSLSQAKKFALKKEMAKARANVIRLTRQQQSQQK